MELLLWRWSTVVQAMSDLMIAVFFVVLARSLGRRELRPWVAAWAADFAALSVAIFFWLFQPQGRLTVAAVTSLYIFTKTLFVVLLVLGAWKFATGRQLHAPYRLPVVLVALFALIGGVLLPSVGWVSLTQAVVIAIGLSFGALMLVHTGRRDLGWLAMGFALRAVLAAVETASFVAQRNGLGGEGSLVSLFIAAHSSFDTGAEWVIALGCVLTLYGTIQRELTQSNRELQTAQDQLQDLLHHDQLTGVYNRRALPAILREAAATGATLLFIDLDHFKRLNDRHGHHVGDAGLVRVALSLRAHFRPDDRIVRYAGDEFVVVSQDSDAAVIEARLNAVRKDLLAQEAVGGRIDFSVGTALLAAQGDPEAALREADRAMYADKATRTVA